MIALYARVSTPDQDTAEQVHMLKAWAEAQGKHWGEVYQDTASGRDLNRPGWQRMVADWRKGGITAVAVTKLDRAFRSLSDMHSTLTELEGRGIRFVATTQPVDTSIPLGKLALNILGSFAEFEREMISERVTEGMNRARREGKRIGRPKSKLSVNRANVTLADHNGDYQAAAESLGVSESTVRRRVRESGGPILAE